MLLYIGQQSKTAEQCLNEMSRHNALMSELTGNLKTLTKFLKESEEKAIEERTLTFTMMKDIAEYFRIYKKD